MNHQQPVNIQICALIALVFSLLCFLLFFYIQYQQNNVYTLGMLLQNPLALAFAGLGARIGNDIAIFIKSRNTRHANPAEKLQCTRVATWMFSVFILLSILQLIANGGHMQAQTELPVTSPSTISQQP
jgi:Kef-type K+ transport system membrane component KefB